MALVTAFSCVERMLGFIYRIFLSRFLGSEGLGLYQVALSVVGLIMTLTCSGIPITVSRIMTKHSAENNEQKGFKTVTGGMILSLILSVPIVLIALLFPKVFSFLFADDRCYVILKIILPGVIITSVYAVIRGYFWGRKMFFTYSLIELLEEAVMLVIGVIFILKATDLQGGIIGASNAVLISYIFSFVTATALYFLRGGKIKSPKGELKPLISSATPITLMRTATSLINTLIAIILPLRLVASGVSQSVALAGFGELSGMSIPLIYIPSTLKGSIALVLVPELAQNFYNKNLVTLKNNVEKAVKCSVFISTLIIPLFISMGREIGALIYNNLDAGEYVANASFIMFPMSISLITTSMLNSLNLEKKTLKYYLFGAVLLIASIWFLPKYVGVYSLVIGLLLSYVITACFNLSLICKTCKIPPKFSVFIIASLIFIVPSTLLAFLLNGLLNKVVSSVISIIITSIVTVAFTYAFYRVFDLLSIKELLNKR